MDDERGIVQVIRRFLSSHGFEVIEAFDGESALEKSRAEHPDIIILDVMLPRLDGLEVLKRLRQEGDIPVILLTARSDEVDRVLGLGLGADDYVVKPFSLRELELRIKAILRRCRPRFEQGKVLRVRDLVLNTETMDVEVRGKRVDLTKAEFGILVTLLSKPGRVFTRAELLNAISQDPYEGYERTVDTHVWSLRKKIEKDPSRPEYVLTVFGVGYKGGGQPHEEPSDTANR